MAMPLLADKILTLFASPLGASLAIIMAGALATLLGWRRSGAAAVLASAALLWLAAMPATADRLMASLEAAHPQQPIADYPAADVAVVLGGGFRVPEAGTAFTDFGEASDRLMLGYQLLKAGKVRLLLLSGGQVFDRPGQASEAEAMRTILIAWGVPPEQIATETTSRTTRGNAVAVAEIWRERGFGSGLLVTSAWHMARALGTFRKAGLELTPAPADSRVEQPDPFPLPFIPEANSLERSTDALKEWLGIFVYRLRGWA